MHFLLSAEWLVERAKYQRIGNFYRNMEVFGDFARRLHIFLP